MSETIIVNKNRAGTSLRAKGGSTHRAEPAAQARLFLRWLLSSLVFRPAEPDVEPKWIGLHSLARGL